MIDTVPEELRARFHGQPVREVVRVAARFHRSDVDSPHAAAKCALSHLARLWQFLDDEIAEFDDHLDRLTSTTAPSLVALNGAGTQTAIALLVAAGDNPHRLRSAASFASLCRAAPLDASSGRQRRHRLNRGGGPPSQRRGLHHRDLTTPMGPRRPGLHEPTTHRRPHQTRDHPMPQNRVARQVYRTITTDLGPPDTIQIEQPELAA